MLPRADRCVIPQRHPEGGEAGLACTAARALRSQTPECWFYDIPPSESEPGSAPRAKTASEAGSAPRAKTASEGGSAPRAKTASEGGSVPRAKTPSEAWGVPCAKIPIMGLRHRSFGFALNLTVLVHWA